METAPSPQKESTESETIPWQKAEENVAAGIELQDDVKTPEDAAVLTEMQKEAFDQSEKAFNEQVKVRYVGKTGLDALAEERAQSMGSPSLSDAEKLKLKELHDVQNGNINENSRM